MQKIKKVKFQSDICTIDIANSDEILQDEGSSESVQVKVARKQEEPTPEEIEEHFARNHVPFRS